MIYMKVYRIIERAVEEGVSYGIHRAHKHNDRPSHDHLQEQIERAVMEALDEVIDFERCRIQEPETE